MFIILVAEVDPEGWQILTEPTMFSKGLLTMHDD